ncbi:MAG: hypothetical protein AAF065_03740 [Verrucomicrobiota bacterium]
MSQEKLKKRNALVMWIIWFGILQSAFVVQVFVGGGLPKGENASEPMAVWLWIVCFAPIVIATVIRWLVIPKLKKPQQMLAAMIIGLSCAESSVFYQLFLIGEDYPQNQIAVLMVAIVALIQFAPGYATPGYVPKKH